jgi:hypothetical protein
MSMLRYSVAAALITAALPLPRSGQAAAQSNVSTQGYGYPQGQLSARALSMGGSIGEIDPSSALNPASIGRLGSRTVVFQIEPEYRSVKGANGTDKTTTARYPLVNIGVPFGEHWVIGVSASSLLDRTWQTSRADTQDIGGDQVPTKIELFSQGAINDLRLATTWTNRRWLYIGVAFSGVTGRNVLSTLESFEDSAFANYSADQILSYGGSAISGGVQMLSSRLSTVFGLSYRHGNSLHVSAGDSVMARGKVPSRFGASLAFTGLPGTVLSARIGHDKWSNMTPMLANAASGEKAHDSWELGGGAEFTGPRVLGQTILLRTGGRSRTLPFEAAGQTVSEKAASLGTGANFGGGRMSADFTLTRQWRNADLPSISERAWTFSLSLTARP